MRQCGAQALNCGTRGNILRVLFARMTAQGRPGFSADALVGCRFASLNAGALGLAPPGPGKGSLSSLIWAVRFATSARRARE